VGLIRDLSGSTIEDKGDLKMSKTRYKSKMSIWVQGAVLPKYRDLGFSKKNIAIIARECGGKVEEFDPETKFARLRDEYGRMIMVDVSMKRVCCECDRPI